MTHHKVIIIGAGISGVKAAVDLHAAGIDDVLIVEARDRLGGRLRSIDSVNSSKAKFDLGALWFHDSLVNPLFEQAIKKGNIDYYFDDGKHVMFSKDSREISPWLLEAVTEEIFTYIQLQYNDPSKKDVSVKEICEEYLKSRKDHLSEEQAKYAGAVVRLWGELWLGSSWDTISAKYSFDGGHIGRNVLVTSGYINVFKNVLHDLPKDFIEKNIKTNENVKLINYTDNLIKVKTNKQEYTCDYIIVTIPPSLLSIKDVNDPAYVQWVPPLPREFTELKKADLEFGSLGKVVFEFDECFWPTDVDRFYGITSQDPSSTSQAKPWDYPTLFLNFQKFKGVPSLVTLTQHPLSQIIENFPPETKTEKIWELFEPVIAQFSNGKPLKPKSIRHTEWNNDIWVRGSYLTRKIGISDPDSVCDLFQNGLTDRVRFAGADTVKGSAAGCAHGGWLSGQREAQHIVTKSKL